MGMQGPSPEGPELTASREHAARMRACCFESTCPLVLRLYATPRLIPVAYSTANHHCTIPNPHFRLRSCSAAVERH